MEFEGAVPDTAGTYVFTLSLIVLCMRSKVWFAAPVLLTHAEDTRNMICFSMGPSLTYPAETVFDLNITLCLHSNCFHLSASSCFQGVVVACVGLFHAEPLIRHRAWTLLHRIETHASSAVRACFGNLNMFMMMAYQRCVLAFADVY